MLRRSLAHTLIVVVVVFVCSGRSGPRPAAAKAGAAECVDEDQVLQNTSLDNWDNSSILPGRSQLLPGEEVLSPRPDPVLWGGRARPGPLTPQQLDTFERLGFLILPDLFTPDHVEVARNVAKAIAANAVGSKVNANGGTSIIALEPGSNTTVKSLFTAHQAAPELRDLMLHPTINGAAEQIVDDAVYVHQSRVNFQKAFVGQGFTCLLYTSPSPRDRG